MDLPRYIGHRGAAAQAPENTLAGFRKAAELGLRWVEFDVRLTRDRRLVLMHDSTLERTTGARGTVAATELADIRHLDAGARFGRTYAMEPVPLLEEALETAAGLGLGANIEMKCDTGLGAETAAVLRGVLGDADWGLPVLVSSFDAGCLRALGDPVPGRPRGYLMRRWAPDWEERLNTFRCETLHLGARDLRREHVAPVKEAGVPLLVYTVNDPARARTLFDWGVDAVFTDAPNAMLEEIAARSA